MKNTKIVILCLVVFFGILSACTETNQVVAPNQKPNVQAYLAPGKPISVNLSTVIAYSETETVDSISRPIDGQIVKIKTSDGQIFTLKSTGNGNYVSANNEIVKFGISYTLDLNYKGLAVSATTAIPPKPQNFKLDKNVVSLTQRDFSQGGPRMMDMGGPNGVQEPPIVASWNNTNGEYHFLALLSEETAPEPVTLQNNTGGRNDFRRQINNAPITASVGNISPNAFTYFGKYAVILYRLDTDYADLFRSGGTNSQNISTPPTAITNGLGIFTGVNTDTLMVTVLKK